MTNKEYIEELSKLKMEEGYLKRNLIISYNEKVRDRLFSKLKVVKQKIKILKAANNEKLR